MSAAAHAKAAGLPSLAWAAAMIGDSRNDNLISWFKNKRGLFDAVIAGCVTLKAKKDAEIPAGLVAVRNHALSQGMSQQDLDMFGGVVALTKPSQFPDEPPLRLYDYSIWQYYYRVENGQVTLLSAPSGAAHRKQIDAIRTLGRTAAHKRQIELTNG